ncbi:hypothetical protein EPUS_08688 [Endocarpon pusillum Z07020]|uniref:Uncharacterized protein n=1 Tax=Endocarpon pusillum (strain Z07020 / HMAS-L-300199) TaxID=1263415 RepID=U1HQP6_ENDPU|nr:uncharacterized protein EPUS_08688 [Endocarpon pusillum Z07020]ERF71419.1 hypothetical protein EPUS_08688 [Endocarpon pusillum Z07020]
MAGVTVHTTSPIHPNGATTPKGASPSTAAARYSPPHSTRRSSQSPTPVTSNPAVLPSPTFASAQPGSTAGPAPTGQPPSPLTSLPIPTATLPALSTRTTSSPPSPQPGAVPSPSYSEARRASIPPPPKAGEVPKPAAYYAPQYDGNTTSTSFQNLSLNTSVPPLPTHQTQGTVLTPTRAQPPPAVTAHATTTSITQDLSHPPGYVQDSRASFSERPPELISPLNLNQSGHDRRKSRSGIGILDGGGGHEDIGDEDKGLWDTAISWAKTVGEKVIEGEEEMWKRINRKT